MHDPYGYLPSANVPRVRVGSRNEATARLYSNSSHNQVTSALPHFQSQMYARCTLPDKEYEYPKEGIVGTPSDKTWRCWHAWRYHQPLRARPESLREISAERRVDLRFGLGSTLRSEIASYCDQRIEVPPSDHQMVSSLLMEDAIQA
jgi:hypothetical protein